MNKHIVVERTPGYSDTLLCPNCGESNLHYESVHVYSGDREGGAGTLTVVDDKSDVRILRCPPPRALGTRRSGIVIVFSCECCLDPRFKLRLTQNDGLIFLEWIT